MKSITDFNLNEIKNSSKFTPSPEAWENEVMYFLMIDRFSDGKETNIYTDKDYENIYNSKESKEKWEYYSNKWNGGNLKGITSKINYLKNLGITVIWLSPIFKQVSFEETYHGYGIQNFLEVDPHFGTKDDLKELVRTVHENGMYIVLDIILNHSGNVFKYKDGYPLWNGQQFEIEGFLDEKGIASIDISNNEDSSYWPDGGIWPKELQNQDTFTRKGQINNWDNRPEYLEGDFFSYKDINNGTGEYNNFTPSDAMKTITECYKYWMAECDIDGYRLDTVKHVEPGASRFFATEIHEFALTLGKNNFYIIGEIFGGIGFAIEILEKTGIDAALGINLIPEKLENAAKGYIDADEYFNIFKNSELLGEGEHKWYKDNVITMFDDHDMLSQIQGLKYRFAADKTTVGLLLNGLILNVFSTGIPCIYYGTEQNFDGSGKGDKYVRECMFESNYGAFRSYGKHFFNENTYTYQELSKLLELRKKYLTLRQGRQYFREISYGEEEFSYPHKLGDNRYEGIFAWSRILSEEEIVVAVNTDSNSERIVYVNIDQTINSLDGKFKIIYSSDMNESNCLINIIKIHEKLCLKIKVQKKGCLILLKEN